MRFYDINVFKGIQKEIYSMRKNKKAVGIAALAISGLMAVSVMGMGFAKWKTDITATGNVSASGKWDVELTAAELSVSKGVSVKQDYSDYELKNICEENKKGQACIEAAVKRTSVTSYPTTGTQNSRFQVSAWLWLVDTTRFDMSKLGTFDSENRRLTMLDGLENGYVIRLSDTNTAPDGTKTKPINAWNYYKSKTDYFGDSSARDKILDGVVAQSNDLIRKIRPDTYYNYALICMAADGTTDCSHLQFPIATMGSKSGSAPSSVTISDNGAVYSDVTFTLPDSWANYTLTVTNKGTVEADLSDFAFSLGSDVGELVILSPDMKDEVLAPGQSCTVNVVVKAVDADNNGIIEASGQLSIKLSYTQPDVEPEPSVKHTNG